jgi:hypothetical protein
VIFDDLQPFGLLQPRHLAPAWGRIAVPASRYASEADFWPPYGMAVPWLFLDWPGLRAD